MIGLVQWLHVVKNNKISLITETNLVKNQNQLTLLSVIATKLADIVFDHISDKMQ